MTAKKGQVNSGEAGQRRPADDAGRPTSRSDSEASGPQSVGPWGTTGELEGDPTWGVSEDSPLDEGSEDAAVLPGRRGERRAAAWSDTSGRHGFGPVEPTRFPEAGPGGPPDPAPARRPFPDESDTGDLPDNALEEQTGMRPERRPRRG
jgi:hypothetical protein